MKNKLCLFFLLILTVQIGAAQRKLPPKSREQKAIEKRIKRNENEKKRSDVEQRWDVRRLSSKSKGLPEVSSWHTGTTGIISSDAAEISLFNATRVGFSKNTELLFRIAEEPFLPNIGLKHLWWESKRFFISTEHTLYYSYPVLKMLQNTGFKDLIPDSVKVNQGIAMRHEFMLSWLMNPQVLGCPNPSPEKILTLRLGTEFHINFGDGGVQPFDYFHSLYHTQLLDGKVLYYGGLQFDSYFGNRFHYSVNGLYYNLDFKKEYAVEANLRVTYYVSRRVGISAMCKGAYMNIGEKAKFACLPLLDITYLINPGRGAINHGLYKNKKRQY